MDGNTLEELSRIREAFEKQGRGFPASWCIRASETVTRRLGLLFVSGDFLSRGLVKSHCWNEDPETGEIIDLTVDQFDSNLPGVYVATSDDRYYPHEKQTRVRISYGELSSFYTIPKSL